MLTVPTHPRNPGSGFAEEQRVIASRGLPQLTVACAVLRAEESQRLPRFYTTAVHGALGRAVYRLVCAFRDRPVCTGCPLLPRCAYPALFETPGIPDPVLQSRGVRDMAPRPLILAPEPGWEVPLTRSRTCAAGEEIRLRLTLVGAAVHDVPLVRKALQKMAERGLGVRLTGDGDRSSPQRARLTLIRFECKEETIESGGDACRTTSPDDTATSSSRDGAGAVTLELVTPLRLTVGGRITNSPGPDAVVLALARRANAFARLGGVSRDVVDEAAAMAAARTVVAATTPLRRVMVRRWSGRQRRRLALPGMMGTLHWYGAGLKDLWPLLRWGELAQVGKGTSLGFGRYSMSDHT